MYTFPKDIVSIIVQYKKNFESVWPKFEQDLRRRYVSYHGRCEDDYNFSLNRAKRLYNLGFCLNAAHFIVLQEMHDQIL